MTINVFFLAAEAEPFIKVGGLGDVAGALPTAIHRISSTLLDEEKIDIRMVLPFHFAIKQKGLKPTFLGELTVESRNKPYLAQVYTQDLEGIPVYFLDGEPIDEKSPVYSPNPIHDGYKFTFFSLAALKLADLLNWRVDILQANDWHTASAIYALEIFERSSNHLQKTKSILTLHNLPFMGFGVQQALEDFKLPTSKNKSLPKWARHAPLPLGLLHADRIIAVSPNYAKEILTPEFGCGLDKFLRTRKSSLTGILNGLDTQKWNPETDPHIEKNFSPQAFSLRSINKHALQREFDLLNNDAIPLLTIISRMDPQKGIDIALRGLQLAEQLPWQAIILGTGSPVLEELAKDLETRFPDRVRTVIDFDSKLAHRLYAGADIFLMPSRYEPCGLSQMIAMRYGCVPLARATGGLADTIKHVSYTINHGSGFLFRKPYPSVFAQTLKRAIKYFQQPVQWKQIQLNGMQQDFSWDRSARKYIAEYKKLIHTQ